MAAKTRSSQHVWLIGFPSDKINGAKLPSGRDVMHFLIKHRENKCTIRESANTTYDELIKIWDQCRIPVKSNNNNNNNNVNLLSADSIRVCSSALYSE